MMDGLKDKYGMVDVFDFVMTANDKELFKINTANRVSISHAEGENDLYIKDAIIDMNVFENIVNGMYNGMSISIYGKSVARAIDGRDHILELIIKESSLESYYMNREKDDHAYTANFVFSFYEKSSSGEKNFQISVLEED